MNNINLDDYRVSPFRGIDSVVLLSTVSDILCTAAFSRLLLVELELTDIKNTTDFFHKLLDKPLEKVVNALVMFVPLTEDNIKSFLNFAYKVSTEQKCSDLAQSLSFEEILFIIKKVMIKFLEEFKETAFYKASKILESTYETK